MFIKNTEIKSPLHEIVKRSKVLNKRKPEPPKLNDVDKKHLWQTGGRVTNAKLSLRIFGDDLVPKDISALLQCVPTHAFKKNDVVPDDKYHRVAPIGSWILKGRLSSENDINAQILYLFSMVTDDLNVWQSINEKYDTGLFCGIFMDDWNEGIELSSEVLNKISERRLKLEFDIYSDQSNS